MPRIEILFEFTATTVGGYCVDVPEDASEEQMAAILAREQARWDESPLETLDEIPGHYSEDVGEVALGWE